MYIEGKQNGLRKIPVLLLLIYFCGGELKEKSTGQNQKHLMECNNIPEILLLFPSISQGKVFNVCLPACRSVCELLGPMLQSDTIF